ncbi:SpoIIE family protein phosphatase [Chromobacterium violaceum]|uniref:SpoIIE family protein phosphatase n=1 Tax=Chromobacterium violaceum TaxID=536 RepID=UPI001B323010|nr:SpoIIE family protein phosphatase [Chromobacterium violaceum]
MRAQMALTPFAPPPGLGELALVSRPCFGEMVCGDGMVAWAETDGGVTLAILDALGHGAQAHALAREMEAWLEREPPQPPAERLARLHRRFQGSLGAAVCLATVQPSGLLACASVGNALLRVLQPELSLIAGQPGTVGQALPRLRERRLQLRAGALLLLTTDGVPEHLPADALAALAGLPAGRMGSQLMSNHAKWHDDAACIVARWNP